MSKLQAKLAELVETTTGAEGAALIDIGTGMALAHAGTPGFDLDVAAQGFATAIRYQLRTITDLGLNDAAEGILVSQGSHHHIFGVRTSDNREGLLVYLVIRRDIATLSAARRRVAMMAYHLPV